MRKTSQDTIFLQGEGNRWYLRNKHALKKHGVDPVLRLLDLYTLYPTSVLDVGSSDGWRLELLRKRGAKTCVGVDASGEAIQSGKKKYPKLTLKQGSASAMPLGNKKFDLVVVNFVLHWVGRKMLQKTLNEIDSRVKPGGFLIIGDFFPDKPTKNPYHHLPGQNVWTFKDFYAQMFLKKKTYLDIAHFALESGTYRFVPDSASNDRIGYWLLRKEKRRSQ